MRKTFMPTSCMSESVVIVKGLRNEAAKPWFARITAEVMVNHESVNARTFSVNMRLISASPLIDGIGPDAIMRANRSKSTNGTAMDNSVAIPNVDLVDIFRGFRWLGFRLARDFSGAFSVIKMMVPLIDCNAHKRLAGTT